MATLDKEKNTKETTQKNLRFQRDQERKKVRGKFIFHEVPGGQMEFVFKKYKEDPLEKFSLVDGQVYTIPLGVARHLNTNCSYPTYKFISNEQGLPQMGIGEKVRRCSFQSLEFIDIDDGSSVPSALPKE